MNAKYFTIAGLLVDIVGAVFLVGNEIWARHKESIEDKLPKDYYEKYYSVARDDEPLRPNTREEDEYESVVRAFPSRQALASALTGAALIIFGFILQLIGAILS